MFKARKTRRFTYLAIGVAVALGTFAGLIVGGLWPQTALHAVATDRVDTFAMATGMVDEDVEAVFFMDFLSGELRALVLGRQVGGISGIYTFNVASHLGIDPAKNPRYMMVTGMVSLRRGGSRMQAGRAVVYVAEITSGKMGAYAIPWNPSLAAAGQTMTLSLVPVAVYQFRGAPMTAIAPPATNMPQ